MFDYHIHSSVSFDSDCPPAEIVRAAEQAGLKEICFTDHYDFNDLFKDKRDLFTMEDYQKAYENPKAYKPGFRERIKKNARRSMLGQ